MKKEEIYTVENAKFANVKYSYYRVGVYGYIVEGDGIVYATVDEVMIDLKNKAVLTTLIGTDGSRYVRNGSFDMYTDPDCYVDGLVKKATENDACSVAAWANKELRCCDPSFCGDCKEYAYYGVWRWENGEPVFTPIVIDIVINSSKSGRSLVDGHLPEKFWKSREEAFMHNEYKVTDDDGEVFTERGTALRLSLTPEQEAILGELKSVYKKALDAGIGFLWDRENCGNVEAYNMQDAVGANYEPCSLENGDVVKICELSFADTGIYFFDYCHDEEYGIAMKPTARQHKEWTKTHPEK